MATRPDMMMGMQGPGMAPGAAGVMSQGPRRVVSPMPSENQAEDTGQRTGKKEAQQVLDAHASALRARRESDLIREKLLLHIDGSGDFQWADILNGTKVDIPRGVSEYRKTENVLRPVVDNAVAHHTTMPLRYQAQSPPDRKSVEKAMMDTVLANHLVKEQDLNGIFAEALYLAMPAGFCPVHRYWREDSANDWFEPVEQGTEEADPFSTSPPSPGMIDCWVGNPFTTVFNRGAKRNSVHWCSYERVLPADLVRAAFPKAKGIEGSDKIPSAAEFQRIAWNWRLASLELHGSPTMNYRRSVDGDELISLICRETAPGVLTDHPNGRLQIIAVPGSVDIRRGDRGSGQAILLADQPLPGRDFSFTNFYSHHRHSDIHGKPWVEDLDQLQVDLNIALSMRWEVINKQANAPMVTPGGALDQDMMDLDGYNVLEVEPSLANWRPRVMEWPQSIIQGLDNEVEEKRRAIFQLGGYQAASRGEAPGSRMAYRAILALQQADNTIHGPVNMRFQRSATDFMRGCWRQMKAYGDIPWLVDITGDEYAHLVEPYIDRTKLSDRPPKYELVNAFGPSPELRAQEILELMTTRGADGEPFLRTREARRQYPNAMIFDDQGDPKAVQRRRAKTVATWIHQLADEFREKHGFQETDPNHPWVQKAAQQVFQQVEQRFGRKRDDDLEAHLSTLSEITQDETADPIARRAAEMRQDLYYQWQAMMSQTPMGQSPGGGQPGAERPNEASDMSRTKVAAEMGGGTPEPGTTLESATPNDRSPIAGTAR